MRHSRWNANLWENTMKASRLKCELNQMWEVPLARKADDFRLRRVISPNPPPFRASPPQSRIFPLELVGSLDVLVEPHAEAGLGHDGCEPVCSIRMGTSAGEYTKSPREKHRRVACSGPVIFPCGSPSCVTGKRRRGNARYEVPSRHASADSGAAPQVDTMSSAR
jgi:hypothetical protein